MSGTIRAATDVGGTFTDFVYFSTDSRTGRQEVVTAKSETTPPHFEHFSRCHNATPACA